MFDVSFTEMLVIAVVALVVIGPERLPKVARTVGHLLGRAQRYVSDVKGDIRREMELDELRTLRAEMEDAARTIKATVDTNVEGLRKEFDEASRDVKELAQEAAQSANVATAAAQVAVDAAPVDASTDVSPAEAAPVHASAAPAAADTPSTPVAASAADGSQPVVAATSVPLPASAPEVHPDPIVTVAHIDPPLVQPVQAVPAPADAPVAQVTPENESDAAQPSLFPADLLPRSVSAPAPVTQAAAPAPRDSEKT